MAWRDQLKGSATFRGVPFFVGTADQTGGRRTVIHEYPLRDEPYVEDMGRRARAFPVEGYVLGEEYLQSRNALIAALEKSGPGELIHPNYGTLLVVCTDFRVRETTADGGMARFSIQFDETRRLPSFPAATPAAAARVDASGDATVATIRARLAARQSVNLTTAAISSVAGVISSASRAMENALAPLVTNTQEAAALRRGLDGLVMDAVALARKPADALNAFLGVFSSFEDLPVSPVLLSALLAAYGFEPAGRPPATTATRRAERDLYDLLLWIIRTLLVVHAAKLAPSAKYDSYDQASAMRDDIAELIDAQLDGADDSTYAALEQLRADLVRAVPGEETDLPRLVRYTPAYTVPSLVLAHRLYGDLSREADLVTRNHVKRPGFVIGGEELELLSA